MQWSVSGPPGGAKNSTQQTAVTARRRETCSVLDQVFWNIWALIILVYIQLNVLLLEMWLIFCGRLWYSIGTSQRLFTGITRIFIVIVINEFYWHRVISHYQQKKWYDWLGYCVFAVMCVWMKVRVVCFDVFGFVWMGLCVWCLCY